MAQLSKQELNAWSPRIAALLQNHDFSFLAYLSHEGAYLRCTRAHIEANEQGYNLVYMITHTLSLISVINQGLSLITL